MSDSATSLADTIANNGPAWVTAGIGVATLLIAQVAISPEGRALRRITRLSRTIKELPVDADNTTLVTSLHDALAAHRSLQTDTAPQKLFEARIVGFVLIILCVAAVVAGGSTTDLGWINFFLTSYVVLTLLFLVSSAVALYLSWKMAKPSGVLLPAETDEVTTR